MAKRHEGMMSLPGLPTDPAAEKTRSDIKVDPIEEMVGALTDPIIVFPSGWEETMPEWMKRDLPLHRLAYIMKCLHGEASWEEVCDLEALIYMYPAALAQPLGEEWTKIYIYLGTKVMGDKMPADIREESIPSHYEESLRDLKRWIRKKKIIARKDRRRRDKAEKAERKEVVPVECEQLNLF
jgi:hypothetical protein